VTNILLLPLRKALRFRAKNTCWPKRLIGRSQEALLSAKAKRQLQCFICAKAKRQQMFYLCESVATATTKRPAGTEITPSFCKSYTFISNKKT